MNKTFPHIPDMIRRFIVFLYIACVIYGCFMIGQVKP